MALGRFSVLEIFILIMSVSSSDSFTALQHHDQANGSIIILLFCQYPPFAFLFAWILPNESIAFGIAHRPELKAAVVLEEFEIKSAHPLAERDFTGFYFCEHKITVINKTAFVEAEAADL